MYFLICFIAWEGIYYVLNFVPVLHYCVQEILLYQKLSRVGARVWCGIKVSELAYNMTLDTVKNRSWTAWIQAYILGLRIPFLRLTPVDKWGIWKNARSGIFPRAGAGIPLPCTCLRAVPAGSAALQGESAAPSEQHDPTGPRHFPIHLFCVSTGKRIGPYSLNTKWNVITINNRMFKPKIPIFKSCKITGYF